MQIVDMASGAIDVRSHRIGVAKVAELRGLLSYGTAAPRLAVGRTPDARIRAIQPGRIADKRPQCARVGATAGAASRPCAASQPRYSAAEYARPSVSVKSAAE